MAAGAVARGVLSGKYKPGAPPEAGTRAGRRDRRMMETEFRAESLEIAQKGEQARHLTAHGVNRNEDGAWSWKFDSHVRVFAATELPERELHALWGGGGGSPARCCWSAAPKAGRATRARTDGRRILGTSAASISKAPGTGRIMIGSMSFLPSCARFSPGASRRAHCGRAALDGRETKR